jgi:hypothetical protein
VKAFTILILGGFIGPIIIDSIVESYKAWKAQEDFEEEEEEDESGD